MTKHSFSITWLPLIILCLAQFLASADNVTLSIATQTLISDLHASLAQVSIANTMYPLIAGTFMVAGGMLGCIWGWDILFRLGCLIFVFAEIFAFFSSSITMFIWGARLLAGIGGSLMIPAVFGLISSLYYKRQRAIAFGALGAASGISFACGPILCGYLLDHIGWKIAFISLGFLALFIFILSFLITTSSQKRSVISFDIFGFLLGTLGLFLTIFGILRIPVWGLVSPFNPEVTIFGLSPSPLLILFGLLILAIMLRWERYFEAKTGHALFPHVFLHTRLVRLGLYLTGWIFFTYSSAIFTVVSFIQVIHHISATQTGLLMLPFAISLSGCSLVLPLLIKQRNPRRQCRLGLLIGMSGALLAISSLHNHNFNLWTIVPSLCLIGASMGVIAANAPMLVTSGSGIQHAEQSGGVQAASRDVGQALGMALTSTVMLTFLTFSMKYQIDHDLSVSLLSRTILHQLIYIPWSGDNAFYQLMLDQNIPSRDIPILMEHYQKSRIQSTHYGLFAMVIATLVLFFRLHHIPETTDEK